MTIGNTSLLHFIYSVHFSFYRLVWFVIVLGLNGYLIFNIYQSILRFSQRPIHTLVGAEHASSIVFPAVTICNYNQFRQSALSDEEIQFLRQLIAAEFGMFILYQHVICVRVVTVICVPGYMVLLPLFFDVIYLE